MVHLSVGWLDLLQLGVKLTHHRVQQYRMSTSETVVVPTTHGKVKGIKRFSVYDDSYYAFEGIPFAKPPVGELRFRAPQAPEVWHNVRDCTSCWEVPLQKHFLLGTTYGAEDCLYLNVYAKKLDSAKPLPVMVWIYGGGFQIGGATRDIYAPDYFMKEDVVLVTINYRIGALGFLSLNDPDLQVPGNAGLKDQILALRWVQDNISHFNGDHHNVTLFGNSAGAASTHLLMLSDQTKGLFHKAILQSGSALCHWVSTPPRNWAYRLAQKIGYRGSDNEKEVFRFLAKIDGKKIVSTDNLLQTDEEKHERILFVFGPVVEPYDSADCVIKKPFRELLATAWTNEIPVIIGGTSFEGLFGHSNTLAAPFLLNDLGDCESVLPLDLKQQHTADELKEKGLRLKHAYFGNKEPSLQETLMEYLDLLSCKYFWHSIHRVVLARKVYASAPTYLYRFDYDSPHFNHYRQLKCGKKARGVSHADDLSYIFYNVSATKLPTQSGEYITIERMIKLWTTFADNSKPVCAQASWEPIETMSGIETPIRCLNISDNLEMIELPEWEKLRIWDSLYTKEELF